MKLSLSELERARKEPKKFAASKLRKFMGMRPTFPMYWVLAAKAYHRLKAGNDPEADRKSVDYFAQQCEAKLAQDPDFEAKLLQNIDKLRIYFASYAALNCPLVQVNKRVVFDALPGHYLSGRVDRLDLDPSGGYVATNFESSASDWKTRLRIPITQQALANELGCRVSEVRVGIYCVETSYHSYVRLKEAEIKQAVTELEALMGRVEAEVRRLRESKN